MRHGMIDIDEMIDELKLSENFAEKFRKNDDFNALNFIREAFTEINRKNDVYDYLTDKYNFNFLSVPENENR